MSKPQQSAAKRAVLLDRDKTLNDDPGYLKDPDEVKLLPGVAEGLRLLQASGFQLHVVTNQSGINRGLLTWGELQKVNARLRALLANEGVSLGKFYVSPARDEDNSDTRKPAAGLIRRALRENHLDAAHTYTLGDRMRDLQAGEPFNLEGVLLGSSEPETPEYVLGSCSDLTSAAALILEREFEKKLMPRLYTSINQLPENEIAEFGELAFTNGCFDILHVGHLQYLWQASLIAKKLIVGLNSDQSVARLKGSDRPINTFETRARALLSLEWVDTVVGFTEDTPEQLLEQLKPNYHIKGGDYKPEELPEYETVKSYGGEVFILPFRKGYSTTKLISQLRSS